MRNNKIFLFLATFCLMAGVFTSCQKDSVTLRLRVASFSHDGKVHMDGYTPKWDTGSDLVCVNGETYTVSNNAVSVSPSIDYKAVYPASICGSLENVNGVGVYNLTIPKYQVYKTVPGSDIQVVEAPMGAHSNTSVGSSAALYFKNLGALLAITVQNSAGHGDLIVDNIVVTSDSKPLWGSATVAMPEVTDNQSNGYNPYYVINEDNNTHRSVTLAGNATGGSMNVSIATGSSKQFYVYVPAFTPSPSNLFTFEVQVHNNSGEGVYRRAQTTQGSGNIALNQIGALTFELEEDYRYSWLDNTRPAGALRVGEFSVSATKKVYFSAGNLQYFCGTSSESPKWRIAEHQYDYVQHLVSNGNNIQPSENNGKWIDLFGWGTNGNNGANPWNYGSSATYCTTSSLGDYDWGHKEIYYGDNSTTDKWRTLTKAEWGYLVGTSYPSRTVRGGSGLDYTISYVKVRVGERDVPGLLLYPDDYSTNNPLSTSASNPALIDLTDYTGCAFLPITGVRIQDGTVTNCVGMNNPQGRYWLADKTGATINYVYFGSGLTNNGFPFLYSTGNTPSYFGYAVRLVSDVPTNNTSK